MCFHRHIMLNTSTYATENDDFSCYNVHQSVIMCFHYILQHLVNKGGNIFHGKI